MAQKSPQAKHGWTTWVPDDALKPTGPVECLKSAVERLGPFRFETCKEAELGPRAAHTRISISRQLAIEQVVGLAFALNRERYLEQGAPRSSDVIENLLHLQKLTMELSEFIKGLDDITLHHLRTGGTGIRGAADIQAFPFFDEADAAGLPAPGILHHKSATSPWLERLEALSHYANSVRTMFMVKQGVDSGKAVDKGGNTNLHKKLMGSTQFQLVSHGWYVYDLFKPREATGTEGGPFHLFVMEIFEFATGLDAEEHSKLTPWVKRVAKTHRQFADLMESQQVIRKEQEEVWRSKELSGPEKDKRFAELTERYLASERERYELWELLYPYTYGRVSRQ
jgi:hypothetical protein